MATCTRCLEQKPPQAFYINKIKNNGLMSWCKACSSNHGKERRSRMGPDNMRLEYRRSYQKLKTEQPERLREKKRRHFQRLMGDPIRREKKRDQGRTAQHKRRALKITSLGLWNHLEAKFIPLMRRAQNGLCQYCQCVMSPDLPQHHPQKENLEHKTPLSRGGSHGFDNWVLACRDCNNRKGTQTAKEFRRTR